MKLIDEFVYRKSILKECEKLKKELEKAIENEDHELVLAIRNQLSAFKLAIQLLDIQPIVYDINKVVEELESKLTEKKYQHENEDYFVGICDAIEIVTGCKNTA